MTLFSVGEDPYNEGLVAFVPPNSQQEIQTGFDAQEDLTELSAEEAAYVSRQARAPEEVPQESVAQRVRAQQGQGG